MFRWCHCSPIYSSVSFALLLILYSLSYHMKLTPHQGSVLEKDTKNNICAWFSIASCSSLASWVNLAPSSVGCEPFFPLVTEPTGQTHTVFFCLFLNTSGFFQIFSLSKSLIYFSKFSVRFAFLHRMRFG